MANTNIIPPRVDFIDQRTGKISREWFMFFYELFRRLGGISSDTSITDLEASVLSDANPYGLVPNSFIDSDRTALTDPNFTPRPFIGIDPRFEIEFSARLEAGLSQLRQEINDSQAFADLGPVAIPDVDSAATVTADTVSAVGYWAPVTDGASNIIYSSGDVVVAFVPTP